MRDQTLSSASSLHLRRRVLIDSESIGGDVILVFAVIKVLLFTISREAETLFWDYYPLQLLPEQCDCVNVTSAP